MDVELVSERLIFSGADNDAFAKLQLQIISSVEEFERNIIRKRPAEGIAKAKERGVNANRKRKNTINVKRVKGLKEEGINNTEIAAHMGISRLSVYRSLNS